MAKLTEPFEQLVAAPVCGKFHVEYASTPSLALTAIGNDFSFADLFSRRIEGLGTIGDVAIGISTSENSGNVLKASKNAKESGLVTIGFCGVSVSV